MPPQPMQLVEIMMEVQQPTQAVEQRPILISGMRQQIIKLRKLRQA
jgi:hypothetical protein